MFLGGMHECPLWGGGAHQILVCPTNFFRFATSLNNNKTIMRMETSIRMETFMIFKLAGNHPS